jgi:hypothetical protein
MGEVVVLMSVSPGFPVPEAVELLITGRVARLHAKLVPAVPLVGEYENMVLLHIAGGAKELVSAGIGLTITTTLYMLELLHPVAESE